MLFSFFQEDVSDSFACIFLPVQSSAAPPWLSAFETPHWDREQKSALMPGHKDVPYSSWMENAIRRFFHFRWQWMCKSSALRAPDVGCMHGRQMKHAPKKTHCFLKTDDATKPCPCLQNTYTWGQSWKNKEGWRENTAWDFPPPKYLV